MSQELHVVFGAGQVGPFVVDQLRAAGKAVRVVKRHASDFPDDVELRLGDAADPAFVRQACAGARVVYHCMNPEYTTAAWAKLVPLYMDNLIAGAAAAGARLVVLDNLYMVDPDPRRPIDEDTPIKARSKKGEIRARAADTLFTAHNRGTVEAIVGRASDFYGPRGTGTHFGQQFWQDALAGKSVLLLPNPQTPHTYHYIPDVGSALVALAAAPTAACGRDWLLPCHPAESTLELVQRLSRALGQPIRVRSLPGFATSAIGLFVPVVRELKEMLYQWDGPFMVNDRRFREQFRVHVTDRDVAAKATVDWARSVFGRVRSHTAGASA
jgi:nucleoside-diphosphate-sugar epimerase